MKYELDSNKSFLNLTKHGLSLEEATFLWEVPNIIIEARTVDEPSFMIIGKIKGKFYSCIFTDRAEATRLISARRSRKEEEALYYESIKT